MNLLYETENPNPVLYDDLEGWEGVGGGSEEICNNMDEPGGYCT